MSLKIEPSDLPTRDYAKIADAMGGFRPITDEDGRQRCIVMIHPAVLQYVCDGLRKLSLLEQTSGT
jgi:hypothetical protein